MQLLASRRPRLDYRYDNEFSVQKTHSEDYNQQQGKGYHVLERLMISMKADQVRPTETCGLEHLFTCEWNAWLS